MTEKQEEIELVTYERDHFLSLMESTFIKDH